MADDETPETPEAADTPAAQAPEPETTEHAVPTEDSAEIAGSAEDAALEAFQESAEHPPSESSGEQDTFEPIPGNAVPTEDATQIAGVAEDAALEAAEEAAEEAVVEAIEEAIVEEVVAEAVEEAIVEELVEEAVEEAIVEELVEEAVEEAIVEELVEEAVEEAIVEELVEEAIVEELVEEAIAEEIVAEAEEDEEFEEEPAPREKPAVPGAHLEVDIVPEGVDPLGRDSDSADPYAMVAEAYAVEGEQADGEGEAAEEDEEVVLAEPISSAAIDLASGARYRATGKRKTAIARVTLKPGTGTYLVNGKVLEEHFPRITLQRNIRQPLETVGYQERMDVIARLHGGGISAQAGALRHGVSRALLEADPNLRGELKRRGFLTRDSRAKERKKAGLKKARKRPQFSKR
jgi:small subunit ribosomal protein S9